MAHKTHDLVVKVGEYTTRDGETKARYENIGALMQGDKGPYVMLKRTFNPAGVNVDPGRDSILVSAFEPRNDGQRQQAPSGMNDRNRAGYEAQAPGGGHGNRPAFDDDIPF